MASAAGTFAELPQFRDDMKRSWDFVNEHYDSDDILGRQCSQTMLLYSVRASHHELPVALSFMSGLFALTNGATIEAFPGASSPLMLAVINVNYPQTRKSANYACLHKLGCAMDAEVYTRAVYEEFMSARAEGSEPPTPVEMANRKPSSLQVASSTLTTFTEAAFFQRCSGDFEQVTQSTVLGGRVHYGCLINLDEAYKLFRMLGLLTSAAHSKSSDSGAGVTDAASEFNRLMQTGTSSLTTKTAGTFGEGKAPTVSMGLAGNAHPAVVLPMDRGHVGSNHAAAKERLLFVTAAPIEPYVGFSTRLLLPAGSKRWLWPQLLKCMVGPLGFPLGVDQPAVAAQILPSARADLRDEILAEDDAGETDDVFVPDASGYLLRMLDGTSTRLRFRRVQYATAEVLMPEIRVANRNVPVPEGQSEKALAARVMAYFDQSHESVPFTASGALTLRGLSTCFDAQCATRRDAGNVMEAARLGAGPWHLAMLSAGLLLMEIAVGEYDGTPELADGNLAIDQHHVVRAYELLQILHGIRAAWHSADSSRDAAVSSRRVSQAEIARNAAAATQPGMPLNVEEYGLWQPTQWAGTHPSEVPAADDVHADAAGESAEAVSGAAPSRASHNVGQPAAVHVSLPSDAEVPDMEVGYGCNGVSVQQSDLGTVILSDREVMKATILRGEAVVYSVDVIGCISRPRRTPGQAEEPEAKRSKKDCLKLHHWECVMKAALDTYRVGTFFPDGLPDADSDARRRGRSCVQLSLPAANDDRARVFFNNRLVHMCQVTYAAFVDAASRKREKAKPRPTAEPLGSLGRPTGPASPVRPSSSSAAPSRMPAALGNAAADRRRFGQ